MHRRNLLFALLGTLVLGCAPLGFAQLQSQPLQAQRTLGYYDPDTRLFEPLGLSVQDAEAAPVVPTTGTLVFNFTITLKSPLPKGAILFCTAQGAVIETSLSVTDAGLGLATLQSGSTYSCSVNIPYSWGLNTSSTDKIVLSYKAQTLEALQVTSANGTGISVTSTAGRVSSHTIPSIPVPANGATTTETVSVTL